MRATSYLQPTVVFMPLPLVALVPFDAVPFVVVLVAFVAVTFVTFVLLAAALATNARG